MQLQPGNYFGKLISAIVTTIGQNNTPAMVLTFDITSRAENGDWVAVEPVNRDVTFWLSEKAEAGTFADLKNLGFDGNMDAPGFAADLTETGTELEVYIETYNGKDQERLRITKLKRGSNHAQASADVRRALAAKFRTAHGSRPTSPPPPQPNPTSRKPLASAHPESQPNELQ